MAGPPPMINPTMRTLLVLAGLLLLSALVISGQPTLVVIATTADDGLLLCRRVEPGDEVRLQFTHSMFGGFVRESWLVTDDAHLERSRFVTENAPAAEYYATDGRVERGTDGFEVLAMPLTEDELVIRVDQRGNHYLRIGGVTVHLAGMIDDSAQVRIRVTADVPGTCATRPPTSSHAAVRMFHDPR